MGDWAIIATGKGCYNGKGDGLDSPAEAGDERFGEVCPAHLLLGGRDVVGDAVMANAIQIIVENGVIGGGVAVSGLADSAGVDKERSGAQFDGYGGWKFEEVAGQVTGVDAAQEWVVGMSDEAMSSLQVIKAGEGGGLGDEVFPDRVSGSAMNEGEVTSFKG